MEINQIDLLLMFIVIAPNSIRHKCNSVASGRYQSTSKLFSYRKKNVIAHCPVWLTHFVFKPN